MKLPCHIGRRCGVIDENTAGLHAVECAVRPDRNAAQVIIVTDTGEDKVCALNRCLWCRRRLSATVLGDPVLQPWIQRSGYKPWSTVIGLICASRCPAIGKPITPNPIQANCVITFTPCFVMRPVYCRLTPHSSACFGGAQRPDKKRVTNTDQT